MQILYLVLLSAPTRCNPVSVVKAHHRHLLVLHQCLSSFHTVACHHASSAARGELLRVAAKVEATGVRDERSRGPPWHDHPRIRLVDSSRMPLAETITVRAATRSATTLSYSCSPRLPDAEPRCNVRWRTEIAASTRPPEASYRDPAGLPTPAAERVRSNSAALLRSPAAAMTISSRCAGGWRTLAALVRLPVSTRWRATWRRAADRHLITC